MSTTVEARYETLRSAAGGTAPLPPWVDEVLRARSARESGWRWLAKKFRITDGSMILKHAAPIFGWRQPGRGGRAMSVSAVTAFEDGGFFRTCRVFWMEAPRGLLEGQRLPHGSSYGLMALTPSGLVDLHAPDRAMRKQALETLLREEGRRLSEGDAMVFAKLFAEVFGREQDYTHVVLASAGHLSDFHHEAWPGDREIGPYPLLPGVLERVSAKIQAPTVTEGEVAHLRDGGRTEILSFATVAGWMHRMDALWRHRYEIAGDFSITEAHERLEKAVFDPMFGSVRY